MSLKTGEEMRNTLMLINVLRELETLYLLEDRMGSNSMYAFPEGTEIDKLLDSIIKKIQANDLITSKHS